MCRRNRLKLLVFVFVFFWSSVESQRITEGYTLLPSRSFSLGSICPWSSSTLDSALFFLRRLSFSRQLFLSCHIFTCNSDFCHVRPTPLTCSSLSYPAMVPYVSQNVCAVCFFQPDLFPCLLSNEPRFPRGSEPKLHAIYTEWTAGALPAKAGRDGGFRAWVKKLSKTSGLTKRWKCLSVPSLSPHFLVFCAGIGLFLPWVSWAQQGHGISGSGQLLDKHHSLI